MKKAIILLAAIFVFSFKADVTKVKIELSVSEVNTLIEGLKKSRIESWQSAELIEKILSQANRQLDTTKNK